MTKTTLLYGAGLAVASLGLQWLDYQYSVRSLATEIYILLVAAGFTALGLWLGRRLTPKTKAGEIVVNDRAVSALGISGRELEVLHLLADGLTNKEIAAELFVSPNTVKTHVARLYEKLDVSRRTQAVKKARSLRLVM